MPIAAALLVVVQWLEPIPAVGEVGAETVVTAHARGGAPIGHLAVSVVRPDATKVALGETDLEGRIRYSPPTRGRYVFEARPGEGAPLLLAPYHVDDRVRRWLWGLLCVPAGLGLTWFNLRRFSRGSSRPSP